MQGTGGIKLLREGMNAIYASNSTAILAILEFKSIGQSNIANPTKERVKIGKQALIIESPGD